MKKSILLILVFLLSFSFSVFADESYEANRYITENGAIVLKSSGYNAGDKISINVLYGDVNWNSNMWNSNEIENMLAYCSIGTADTYGECTFAFILPGEGIYTAVINGDEFRKIIYCENALNSVALENIKSAASQNEVLSIIDSSKPSLGVGIDIYSVNDLNASAIVYAYLNNSTELIDGINLAEAIDKAYLISAIKDGRVTNINDYLFSSGISNTSLKKYYKSEYNETVTLSAKRANSIAEYDYNIKEAIVLSTIKKSANVALIKDAITEYASLIGIEKAKISNELCQSLNKKEFNSFQSLKEYINKFEIPSLQESGSGGSASSNRNDKNTGVPNATYSGYETSEIYTNTENIFKDLEGFEWAKDAIRELYYKGIVSGKKTGYFHPKDYVTREEFVKMIIEATKLNVIGSNVEFYDVSKEAWYYPYVNKAYNARLIKGISETMFGTGQNIKRQDIAIIISNLLYECDIKCDSIEKFEFADKGQISDYAIDAVELVRSSGIMIGDEKHMFNPQGFATRAEAAKIIFTILEYVN